MWNLFSNEWDVVRAFRMGRKLKICSLTDSSRLPPRSLIRWSARGHSGSSTLRLPAGHEGVRRLGQARFNSNPTYSPSLAGMRVKCLFTATQSHFRWDCEIWPLGVKAHPPHLSSRVAQLLSDSLLLWQPGQKPQEMKNYAAVWNTGERL